MKLLIIIALFFPTTALAETTREAQIRLIEIQIRLIEELIMAIVELINKLAGY